MKTKTKKSKQTKRGSFMLEEHVYSPPSKVDRENGIIYDVKILGVESGNTVPTDMTGGKVVKGYAYSKSARSAMAALCEGMGVNIDHPNRKEPMASRSFRDRFGKLQDVREKPDGVYGNLHFLKSHAMAEQVCEAAERMPEVFGLSPVAFTDVAFNGSGYVVEGVQRVRSVDIVQKPATNASLFEDEEEEPMAKEKYKDVLKEQPKMLALLEEFEPGMTDTPVEDGCCDSDAAIRDAFRSIIISAFDDETLDSKATIDRVKEVLKAYYKLMEKPEDENEEGEDDTMADDETVDVENEEETPTEEDLREEMEIRDMLWKAGVEPTKAKVSALYVMESEDDRQELVESFKAGNEKAESKTRKRVRSGFSLEEDDGIDSLASITSGKRSFADAVKAGRGGYSR